MRVLLSFQKLKTPIFYWNMDDFKFDFLSRGELESLILNKIFLPLFKTLPCYEVCLVTLFLPLLLESSVETILVFL